MNAMIKWYPYFAITISAILVFLYFYDLKKFHKWVYVYWGKKPTAYKKLQSVLYIISISLFIISLADWRGKEVNLEGQKQSEKTVILIDNSLSMLAEDVRPNRFEKAILMARHFLKAAPGHEIAIGLFSDVVIKYVPFTTDIDLLDARISGLKEEYKNVGGSSNIRQAIREGLTYINPNPLARKGNIVIFTDADGMDDEFPLEVGDSVSVALIAISTSTGAPVPVRSRDGVLKGYKTYHGEQVTSKLNQEFIDRLKLSIKNYQYWVVSSYSLPTEEILRFLNNKWINSDNGKQKMRMRETLFEWWVVPALILLILSSFLKYRKNWSVLFVPIAIIGILLTSVLNPNIANAQNEKIKELVPLVDALKNNQLDDKGKAGVAQKYLEAGDAKKASTLYGESLENKPISEKNKHSWLNYAQSLSLSKRPGDAIKKMKSLQDYLDNSKHDQKFKDQYREALLGMLKNQEQQQKQQQEQDKKNKEDEHKQNDQNNQNNKDSKGSENEKKKDSKSGENEKDQNKNKDKSNETESENKNDKKENEEKRNEQKSKDQRQKELSALLKQALNEDRALQQKLMNTSSKDDKKNAKMDEIKDW